MESAEEPTSTTQLNPSADLNFHQNMAEVSFRGSDSELSRGRPHSASIVSRRTTSSVTSKTSRATNVNQTKESIRNFFAYRPGIFENAVEDCQQKAVKADLDGSLLGAWLLAEIDHWDCEKEKVVMLTDNSLLVCKYDFIALKVLDTKRLMLHNVKIVAIGDMVYPEKSVMPPRTHGGVRVIFGREEDLTFIEKWNPFSSSVPYFTFIHHPILYCHGESETVTYNVDDFHESLVQQTNAIYRQKKPGESLQLFEGNILIESYASLTSMVYNQSMLGFSKERGGVSF